VTLATALVSLLRGQPIRPGLAMTGEVTLSGRVLPVGGIKEKVLAAHRTGLTTVILPRQNERQLLEDVPAEVRGQLEVHLVRDVAEVLRIALPDAAHWDPLDRELELELAGKDAS
jgi:ATP-dependent Lon protease